MLASSGSLRQPDKEQRSTGAEQGGKKPKPSLTFHFYICFGVGQALWQYWYIIILGCSTLNFDLTLNLIASLLVVQESGHLNVKENEEERTKWEGLRAFMHVWTEEFHTKGRRKERNKVSCLPQFYCKAALYWLHWSYIFTWCAHLLSIFSDIGALWFSS